MKKRPAIIIGTLLAVLVAAGAAYLVWDNSRDKSGGSSGQGPSHQQNQNQPSQPQKSYVDKALEEMSLRDKVASLFVLHVSGTDSSELASYFSAHKPAGLIFMGDNIPFTFDELRAQTGALVTDKKLPPLIALDEEGDTVKRLAADTYPGALTLRNQPPEAAKEAFAKRSDLLKSLGINLNFGIIADVTSDPNSFIYPRVLGTAPQAASERVAQAVAGSKGRTLSTIKHFPGHGETSADSHSSIPTAATTYDDWRQRVALPFKAGIDAGADLVMFGHLRYSEVDEQPATLSAKWHEIVRNELGFKGVIVTDDMIMLQDSGEAAFADPVANAVAALQAGSDLLLYVLDHGGKSGIDPNVLIDGVLQAVNDGRLEQKDIDDSVRKVLELRYSLGKSFCND